ncbi:hypothetical protein GOP47_0019078 [Adiantum capillus-veneris]|uniref:Ufm1-specific protease n=1 Tax=Adiantum capillus-veneris TaxID=13818 RepID=A0A9D4UEF1_ADICA|nr:hypothetical protein GOP47_0019078 [Adiantum capillus-veneris]
MAESIRLLCDRYTLESKKEGVQWLVGSHLLPRTVISILNCLHFKDGDPDIRAESADIRTLLPKGLEIVGAVLNEEGGLETARRAAEIALKLSKVFNNPSMSSSGLIVACLSTVQTQILQFYHGTRQSLSPVDATFYNENPSAHLWESMCLLHCKLLLTVPLYATSFASPADYGSQLSAAISRLVKGFKSEELYCLVEGSATMSRKLVPVNWKDSVTCSESKLRGLQEDLRCLDCCSGDTSVSLYGLQMPMPVHIIPVVHQSGREGKHAAPCAEYLPVSGQAVLRILNLSLTSICVAHRQLLISEAITSLVVPALTDQLLAMQDILMQEFSEHPKLCSYTFCPPGFIHPISCIYNVSYGESEFSTVERRRLLHKRLNLPLDRPLLRVANALSFSPVEVVPEGPKQGRLRLINVHINMPTGSGVVGGRTSIVQGSYEYYHYLQDNFNDNGWGCAYRSLQTIVSWFKLQHYTATDVPTHEKIQETLVRIGDKEPSFKGSQNWIGAIELSFVLDELLGASSKILNVRSGAELPEKCRELALHFETQGTPVMIGGGVLAYTLLGVDYNDTTGDCAFLILDPHYTGGEDLKTIWAGGWCGWKKPVNSKGEEFFLRSKFYNLLLPQRPNTI